MFLIFNREAFLNITCHKIFSLKNRCKSGYFSSEKSPNRQSVTSASLVWKILYPPIFYQKKLVYLCFLRLSEWKVSQPSPTGLRPCVDPTDLWDISGLKNLYPVPFPSYVWITGEKRGPAKWLFTSTNGSTIFILRIFNLILKKKISLWHS